MAHNTLLIGSLTASYTATEYANLGLKVGMVYKDEPNGKAYIFLKNSGATAITEKLACVALTTDKQNRFCTLAAATAAVAPFAGVRVVGATSMAQGEYGWFQCCGSATFTASSDTTTAEIGVVTSNQTAGTVEAAADTGVGSFASFGIAETTTASAAVVVHLSRNVWGVTI
jgi:hypothetical protein